MNFAAAFLKGDKMKRKKSVLRVTAAQAKSRLVTGFWQQRHEKASLQNIITGNNEDEQFYRRVAGFLRDGENPLARVLDSEHMATLDEASRQRYVLNMSMLVQKSVTRYHESGKVLA